MLQMTQLSEQEVAVETLMASKGFSESVVSLTADSADIALNSLDGSVQLLNLSFKVVQVLAHSRHPP